MMRALQLAAIGAFRVGGRLERMVRPSHVAARRRGFLFWNGHGELAFAKSDAKRTPLISQK
jgi:hypothetical protein